MAGLWSRKEGIPTLEWGENNPVVHLGWVKIESREGGTGEFQLTLGQPDWGHTGKKNHRPSEERKLFILFCLHDWFKSAFTGFLRVLTQVSFQEQDRVERKITWQYSAQCQRQLSGRISHKWWEKKKKQRKTMDSDCTFYSLWQVAALSNLRNWEKESKVIKKGGGISTAF